MKYLLISIILVFSGCESAPVKPIVPPRVTQTQASFSETGKQDSGVIGFVKGKGFELTPSAVLRYKNLAVQFNKEPIGLVAEDGKTFLSNQGMVLFLDLNELSKQPK